MRHLRAILFPFDFSGAGLAMAPYVVSMAQRFSATVTVLHAVNLVPEYDLGSCLETTSVSTRTRIPYTPAFQELRDERQRQLEEFAKNRFAGVNHATKIEDGDPAAVIECVAQRENVDLIMMPTKGLGKFRRMLVGSVTAKVLHDVDYPIFTTAHESAPTSAPVTSYRSIVCAVDLTREADAVLQAAALIGQVYGAKVCLIHMVPEPSTAGGGDAIGESIRQALDQSIKSVGRNGDDVKVRVLDEEIPEGVRRIAIEEDAELVVVGRGHEEGNVSRMWSHLYTIIRESPCPVLSV